MKARRGIFDNQSLQAAVATQLKDAGIPDGHKNAFALIATTSGVKAVVSLRVNDVWQIDSVVNVSDQKKIEGGISIKASW